MALTNFHDILFPIPLSYGALCRVQYKNSIITTHNGDEERLMEWLDPLRSYDITPMIKDQTDLDTVLAFFRGRKGAENSFRFRDPIDNTVTTQQIGTGDGSTQTFQLYQVYSTGISGDTYTPIRIITKPVSGTVTILVNDVVQASGWAIDYATGVLTFTGVPNPGDTIKWSGTFDVPVRFQTEELPVSIRTFEYFTMPVVFREVRDPATVTTNITEPIPPATVTALFPEYITEGSVIGPKHHTVVFSADSGYEERAGLFTEAMMHMDLRKAIQTSEDMLTLLTFFHARKGRFQSFSVKDITDYQQPDQIQLGTGDDTTHVFNLSVNYTSGAQIESREVKRPVSGTVKVYLDAVEVTQNLIIDYANGTASFTVLQAANIQFINVGSILRRSSGDWSAHGLSVGDKIKIVGSVDNDQVFTIATGGIGTLDLVVDEAVTDEASVSVAVHLPPLSGQVITWTGDFYTLCRFDTDELAVSVTGFDVQNWESILLTSVTDVSPIPEGTGYVIAPGGPPAPGATGVGTGGNPGGGSPEQPIIIEPTGRYIYFDGSDILGFTTSNPNEVHLKMHTFSGASLWGAISHFTSGTLFCSYMPGGSRFAQFRVDVDSIGSGNRAKFTVYTHSGTHAKFVDFINPGNPNPCDLSNAFCASQETSHVKLSLNPGGTGNDLGTGATVTDLAVFVLTFDLSDGVGVGGSMSGKAGTKTDDFQYWECFMTPDGCLDTVSSDAKSWGHDPAVGHTYFTTVGGCPDVLTTQNIINGFDGRIYELGVCLGKAPITDILKHFENKYKHKIPSSMAVPANTLFYVTSDSGVLNDSGGDVWDPQEANGVFTWGRRGGSYDLIDFLTDQSFEASPVAFEGDVVELPSGKTLKDSDGEEI